MALLGHLPKKSQRFVHPLVRILDDTTLPTGDLRGHYLT